MKGKKNSPLDLLWAAVLIKGIRRLWMRRGERHSVYPSNRELLSGRGAVVIVMASY